MTSNKIPYSVVMIMPLSVGRGHGPKILRDLMDKCPITLRKFRSWSVCNTTWRALCDNDQEAQAHIDLALPPGKRDAWICLFTHLDRTTDPTSAIESLCGPLDLWMRQDGQLRYKYWTGNMNTHVADAIVRIAQPTRARLEASLLFRDFDESLL